MSKRVKLYDFQITGIDTAVHALQNATIEMSDGFEKRSNCFLLHDEMGLGKTIQAFEIMKRLDLKGPSLVVVPSSCIHIWQENEYYKNFFDIRIGVSTANMAKTTEKTIIVTSYDSLRNAYKYYISDKIDQGGLSNDELIRYCLVHGKYIERTKYLVGDALRRELLDISRSIKQKPGKPHLVCSAFMKQEWSLVIFDEVHKTRSIQSSATKAVGFINAKYRLALSGTPIMNYGSELLCIWKYALGLFDLKWNIINSDPDSDYCKKIIDTISLGRKKTDIPELAMVLPKRDKTKEDVIIEWEDFEQKQDYVNVKLSSIDTLKEVENLRKERNETGSDFNKRRLHIQQCFMAKMQILRQICIHKDLPSYMGEGRGPIKKKKIWNPAIHSTFSSWNKECIRMILKCLKRTVLYPLRILILKYFIAYDADMIQPSPKMIYTLKEIERLKKNDKMIIFSTFKVFFSEIMQPWLEQIGIESLMFCGGSRSKQQSVLKEFRTCSNIKVLLIVKSAGSEGLNMQFDANVCIIMDPHFNLAVDEQAAQRIDRIGQEKEVIVRKLYMKGSIDEAMKLMQTEKQINIEAWNGGGEGVRSIQTQGLFLSKRDTVSIS